MTSPRAGQSVVVQGVVTADHEGAAGLRGFYMQDILGGNDAAVSVGVFVFNGERDDVSVGDVVRVQGMVDEVLEQTQITAVSVIACDTGRVDPVDITLPLPSAAHLERYEGMLVRMPQTLYVTEHYQLGRYGEVVLSAGGRLPQPTAIAEPGAAALAVQAANDLNRLILDDASLEQNPALVSGRGGAPLDADNTLRGGDHVTGLVGVLTQTPATGTNGVAYRIRPVRAGVRPGFSTANARPYTPPDVGGTLRVASFNVLNYFNTFDGCTAGFDGPVIDCRGADNATEFERQAGKIVAAIAAMDAHVIGILEIENDGYGAASALGDLVNRLNAATARGRYAFVDADAGTGQRNALGTDAIKVALIYQPARVTPVGRTAALNTSAFVTGGDSAERNRPSLAQAFAPQDGGRVIVSINHFKSKASPCDAPDAGDGQGNCNGARVGAARELLAWIATDPARGGTTHVLLLGDFNAYPREDPIATIVRGGFTNLLALHAGERAYSYVFNGQWGPLDHAFTSGSLLPHITGAASWSINADEPPALDYNLNFKTPALQQSLYRADPFRSSDHDPIIIGLRLPPAR